jgi:cobaltochelatase CobS
MEFTVEEVTLEPVPMKPTNSGDEDKDAEALAQALQEAINEGLKKGMEAGLSRISPLVNKAIKECESKIAHLSNEYSRPRDLLLRVKLGDMPEVKLKSRASKILPSLLAQAEIARSGHGNWPMIIGPTGSGKTIAAEQVAETLKLNFSHICFSQGASESWLWGRQTPTGFISGEFWNAYKNGGVFLADEMDAADSNLLMSINTSIANGHAYNPILGESAHKHGDFVFIAAANTNGKGGTGAYTGRSRLDAATLNRFSIFVMEYDNELEKELCPNKKLLKAMHSLRSHLADNKSLDVVSTRDIKNGYAQLKAGFTMDNIMHCLGLRMDSANQEYIAKEYGEKK